MLMLVCMLWRLFLYLQPHLPRLPPLPIGAPSEKKRSPQHRYGHEVPAVKKAITRPSSHAGLAVAPTFG